MMRGGCWIGVVVLATLVLTGCAVSDSHEDGLAASSDWSRFVSQKYGLVFDYPGHLLVRHEFQTGYFLRARWNRDAPKEVPGDALLALRLPGSNEVTKGILRLGASAAPGAVQHCLLSPSTVAKVSRGEAEITRIGGVEFQRVTGSGAGMSHYLHRRSYRGVHNGQCIAIDLIVAGTNPQVYAPPRTPPFSVDAALRRLTALLAGIRFTD